MSFKNKFLKKIEKLDELDKINFEVHERFNKALIELLTVKHSSKIF